MIFHHIGLFVGDLSNGLSSLKKIIPIKQISQIVIEDKLDVEIQFCKDSSGIVYELIAPKGLDSPVLNTLKTKNNILNHVAYIVKNIEDESEKLRKIGAIPISEKKPAKVFNGALVSFFLTDLRFIIEIIESSSTELSIYKKNIWNDLK